MKSYLSRYNQVEFDKEVQFIYKSLPKKGINSTVEIEDMCSTRNTIQNREKGKKIQQQNKLLMDILEALPYPFYVIDANDYTIKISNSAANLGALSGKSTCYELTHRRKKPCDDKHPCTLKIVKATKKPAILEHIHYDKNENARSIEVHGYPIFDVSGNVVQIIEYCIDITERKMAEETKQKMVNDLAMVVDKLGVIGEGTRHDTRNKLSIITNNVYLAKQQLERNHPALKHLDAISLAIEQIENIFDFSRTYEMIGTNERTYVDVTKSITEATQLVSGLGSTKLVNECHNLRLLADLQLRQLFYNLIDNSLKHGEKVRQIKVYYKVCKDHLKLIYEDDGIGVPKAEKKKIFRKGYGKGTGYGLYLIHKICESYGWNIQETGIHGKGVQFTITLPQTHKNGRVSYQFH